MEGVAASGRVALALLGGWRLTIDGQPATAPAYEKGRALLAYLAIENRWLSRDVLGALFWPDSFSHRANLRQVLANLRAVLQDNDSAAPYLLVRRDAMCIGAECADRLDVARFLAALPRCDAAGPAQQCAPCLQRMEQAEGLYRGEFMAGLSLADCPEFEEWLRRKRETLRRHAVALCGRLADCHERYGRQDSALAFARRATDLDPWDEAAQRRLMQLLIASGQSAAALRHYRELAASLARDVGIEPEAATQAIHRRMLAVAGEDTTPAATSGAATGTDEVRRVVVLVVEVEQNDDTELLEPEGQMAPVSAALDAALSRWTGQRFPTTGLALGAAFGLAGDGEQAPRRALRAALELAALPAFGRARIGICEGKALIGPATRQSIAASPLPALAARLALCGEPGDVIAVESLAGEPGTGARCEPLGQRRFTGLAGEHAACRLTAASEPDNPPYPTAFTTPFVGRNDELARLKAALASAGRENRALFIELSGLAGTGKSRLLAKLAGEHRADGGEVRWIGHRPELRHDALGALRESFRRRIAGPQSDGEHLDAWLERFFPAQRAALRAPLRRFLAREGEHAADISAGSLIGALLTLVFSPPSRQHPVLLVFDDLHWADEATREMLQLAMQSPPAAPILTVLSSRPATGVELPPRLATAHIELKPLAPAQTRALIAAIDSDGAIAAARHVQLARLSGGLPLHAEYLARSERDHPVSAASLFGILQGMLDRLGPHKPALQAASVLGVSFCGDSLRALVPEQDLAAALELAGTLAISHDVGEGSYAFCHALLRDCAYDSVPPQRRRDWHRRAAAWLSQQPDAAAADIAQHFEAAHAWREARDFWAKAAQAAYLGEFARDAREAVARALAAAARDREPLAAAEQAELELLAGYAALMSDGYGAKEAQRLFAPTAARAVGELPDETLIRGLTGMAAAIPQGRTETLAIMNRLEGMARMPAHRMMVGYGFGSLLFWRGEFAESLRRLEGAIRIGEPLPAREWLRYSADNPVVACNALKGINLAFSGTAASARDAVERSLTAARRDGRAHGLCFALTLAAGVNLVLDRPDEVEELAAEGLALARQRHFPLWQAYNTLFGMWAKARQERLHLRSSFKLISMHREFAAASRLSPVTSLWFAGCIFEALDSWTLLDATTARALAKAENGGDRYCMPDLMRQKSLARHGRGDVDGARRWLEQAVALATASGSHGLIPRLERARERMFPPPASPPG